MNFQFDESFNFLKAVTDKVRAVLDDIQDHESAGGRSYSSSYSWELISMLEMAFKALRGSITLVEELKYQESRYISGEIAKNEYVQYQQVMHEYDELNEKIKHLENKLKHLRSKNVKLRDDNTALADKLKEANHNVEELEKHSLFKVADMKEISI